MCAVIMIGSLKSPFVFAAYFGKLSHLVFFLFVAVFAHSCFLIPLFSEADEILNICNVIGSPDEQSCPQGLSLAEVMKYQFPQVSIRLSFFFVLLILRFSWSSFFCKPFIVNNAFSFKCVCKLLEMPDGDLKP